jgi:plasmid maintenance system antidote protein VapI
MGKKELHPVHPGEVLSEEFLKPMGLSQNRLALDISVPRGVSTKSCWESGVLQQIPHCD